MLHSAPSLDRNQAQARYQFRNADDWLVTNEPEAHDIGWRLRDAVDAQVVLACTDLLDNQISASV